MKRLPKSPIIAALTFAVFVFSIYCCCFIHPAQAKEKALSCHQTDRPDDQSRDSQECDCHKDLIGHPQLEKTSNIDLSQSISSIVLNHISLNAKLPIQLTRRSVPGTPPNISSAVPLYIKHSTFRI